MFAVPSLELTIICGFYSVFLTLGLRRGRGSQRFRPAALSADAFSDDDAGCLSGPGDLSSVSKSNCQNKPKFIGVMRSSQLRGRGFVRIIGWCRAFLFSPISFITRSCTDFCKFFGHRPDISCNQLFHYSLVLLKKAITECYTLPSTCTATAIQYLWSDEIQASFVHVRGSLLVTVSGLKEKGFFLLYFRRHHFPGYLAGTHALNKR